MKTNRHSRRATRHAALHRAHARHTSDGAVMFIVVVTLGLLAAMGVYGLSSTSADIKSAGHMREALQGQRAGEHAMNMTAETLNPAAAKVLVDSMFCQKRTIDCKTATPYATALGLPAPATAACRRLNETEMKLIAAKVNPFVSGVDGFAPDSFGPIVAKPNVEVEMSNPIDIPPPPGSAYDPSTRFTQVTVTVFVNVRNAPTEPAVSVVTGRGRLTIGPITGATQCTEAP